MKFIFTLMTLVFFSLEVNAQKHFVPGWVTLPQGDTIKGFIGDRAWEFENPEFIMFKNKAGEVTKYYPYQITYFGLGSNAYYKSAITLIDENLKDEILNGKEHKKPRLDTLFLTVMIKDKLSLYKIISANRKKHYYIEKDGNIFELVEGYQMALDPTDNNYKLGASPYYLGTLSAAIRDCAKMSGKVRRGLKLSDAPLFRIVSEYNSCVSSAPPRYSHLKDKGYMRWGLIAGLSMTQMKFTGRTFENKVFPISVNPIFGISAFYTLPGYHLVNGISTEFVYYRTNSEAMPYQQGLTALRLNLAYRYTFSRKKWRPFIQAGFPFTKIMKYTSNGNNVTNRVGSGPINETGHFIGIGFTRKKLTGEIRFQKTSEGRLNIYPYFNAASFSSGYLQLTYKIGGAKKE